MSCPTRVLLFMTRIINTAKGYDMNEELRTKLTEITSNSGSRQDERNRQLLVGGLEGSGKSRDVLDCVLNGDIIDFESRYVVYAANSYKLLSERQAELMKSYGLTERECPIITKCKLENIEEHNKQYIGNNPRDTYPIEAKVILMTIQAVKKCHHTMLEPEKSSIGKIFSMLIVDEFDFCSCLIPRLDHLVNNMIGSKSITTIRKFVTKHWSRMDADRLDDSYNGYGNQEVQVAYYIDRNRTRCIPTVFISSEKVAELTLSSIGFDIISLGGDKFKNHTLNVCPAIVNRFLYGKLNQDNSWGIFGSKTIIADKYDKKLPLIHDTEIINHMQCRGSNKIQGEKSLLSIVSHVPANVINSIYAAVNSPYSFGEEPSRDEIQALYYRDRVMQAIGRVLGYRGERHGVQETWLIISDGIWESIQAYIASGVIDLPYSVKEWCFEHADWKELQSHAANMMAHNQENRDKHRKYISGENEVLAKNLISDKLIITRDTNDYIPLSVIKKMMKDANIVSMLPKSLGAMQGLIPSRITRNGKTKWVFKGVKVQ